MGLELPTKAPVLRSALKGIARSHAEAGTKKRTRLPISWERILQGEKVVPKWGKGGYVMWFCRVQLFFRGSLKRGLHFRLWGRTSDPLHQTR